MNAFKCDCCGKCKEGRPIIGTHTTDFGKFKMSLSMGEYSQKPDLCLPCFAKLLAKLAEEIGG